EVLLRLREGLDQGRPARALGLSDEDRALVRDLFLLTLKPVMYVANVAEDGFDNNPHLDRVRERAEAEGAQVVPVCAAIEEELAQLDEGDRAEFLATMGLDEPGLNRVIRAGYALLGMQTYFTAGVKEVRAWQVRRGSTAPQAAGVIHSDFEKGFIRAETISFEDFIRYGGEGGAGEAGRLRLEGKEYVVQEGDVLHCRFNVWGPARPLHSKALTIREPAARITGSPAEGYPSGQRGQTVNLLAYAFGGSNPPPSTSFAEAATVSQGGSSSMVEPQPSKLIMRVRFPSPAPLD